MFHTIDNKRMHWGAMHTAPGTYNFSAIDAVHATWPNVQVCFVLYGCPTYLAQPADQGTPDAYGLLGGFSVPTNYADMQAFLVALLTTRPWITMVQLGNEMLDSGATTFWNGTAAQAVDYHYFGIQGVASCRPDVLVGNYGAFDPVAFGTFLDATGPQCGLKGSALALTLMCLHPYFGYPNLRTYETGMDINTLSSPGGGIDQFTKLMTTRGMAVLPVVMTEAAPTSGTTGASAWRHTLFTTTYTPAQRRTYAFRVYAACARNPRVLSYGSFSFISASNLCGDMTEVGGYGYGIGDAQSLFPGKTLLPGAGYDSSGIEYGTFSDGSNYGT